MGIYMWFHKLVLLVVMGIYSASMLVCTRFLFARKHGHIFSFNASCIVSTSICARKGFRQRGVPVYHDFCTSLSSWSPVLYFEVYHVLKLTLQIGLQRRYGYRAMMLETVAAVLGMETDCIGNILLFLA